TTINYYLAKKSQVKLRVFDILGKVVATLFEGTKSNGNYEINFDGNHLSSGVYYYRLEADKYVETRKFVLLK
ncbi:MAG: T9SS type A sorting domain-containing protein, partial [Melioribacteraceae bacterium]|nr:T9SS type A sorting domain-containing protein [Melioribacteraceae bacterium]